MKRYIASAGILIILVCFAVFMHCRKVSNTVLNIIDPVMIQVDLNNNGAADDNETVCIPGVETFSLNLRETPPDFAKDLNLTQKDLISMGYLADEFSNNLLNLRQVKVELNGGKSADCRYGDIIVDGEKYSEKLLGSGFAAQNGTYAKDKFQHNLETAKHLKLAVLNNKSYKYHTLDCEYGILSADYAVMPEKQLPKDAVPCKFCHTAKESSHPAFSQAKSVMTDGSISLLLTDFTKTLVPNRNCTSDVCTAVLKEINNAQKSIDIAVYGWDNVPLLNETLKKAKARGVKIRVVYDKAVSPDAEYYKETDTIQEFADEYRTDFNPNNRTLTAMLMHNKFLIFDNSTVITGSMNISATGTSGYNANTILIINSKEVAELYTAEFEQMLGGKFHTLKSKPGLPNNFTLNDSKISIYFSPYDNTMKYIIPLIDGAKKYIYMPTFLITHTDLANALIRARQRGVEIKVIIDANNTSTRNTKHTLLRKNGILVKSENYAGKMHSKSIIIDDKYIVAGSMNFSNSGETKNDENVVIIENPKLAGFYRDFFLYLWSRIPDKWLKQNAHPESSDSIGSCDDGIDNDFDGLTDSDDPGCR